MSTTGNESHSNPISRVFSRIFHRDDAPKATSPSVTTTPPTAATNEPQQITPRVVPPAPALQASNAQPAQTPATSPAAVAPTPTATQRTYTVQQGDSLSKIAKHVYGDAERWHLIFDANRERISDPDRIYPGQVLMLPDPPSLH